MLDRVPRPAWILSLLFVLALGLALGVNALLARAFVVDADKLAAAHEGAPPPSRTASRTSESDEPDAVADAPETDRSSSSNRPRRLKFFQDPIVRRNIFDANAGPDTTPPPPQGEGDESLKSEIDAILVSTAEASDPTYSTAMISVSSSAAEPYRIGDPIADATIIDIRSPWLDSGGTHHTARVIVLRDGVREYIDAGGKPKTGARPKRKTDRDEKKPKRTSGRHTWDGIRELGDGKYGIDQAEIDYALGNMDKLSREARVVPNFTDGSTNGWKVFSIRRNSALRKMGLKNNDVLTAVNGFDLGDTDKILELYSKLQTDKNFSLEVLRNGEPMTLEYAIQ